MLSTYFLSFWGFVHWMNWGVAKTVQQGNYMAHNSVQGTKLCNMNMNKTRKRNSDAIPSQIPVVFPSRQCPRICVDVVPPFVAETICTPPDPSRPGPRSLCPDLLWKNASCVDVARHQHQLQKLPLGMNVSLAKRTGSAVRALRHANQRCCARSLQSPCPSPSHPCSGASRGSHQFWPGRK